MKRTESINLKGLAAALNLSQTTVSRALNGYADVSESTRELVIEAANRMNYRPNPVATRLATGRSHAVGHVIPVTSKLEMVNPIFGEFLAGTGETCSRFGYQMVLSVVPEQDVERAYQSMAEQGLVDGIILQCPGIQEPRIDLLRKIGLPFVMHGRAIDEDPECSWLDINNRRSFRHATSLLIAAGHRRIGLINGQEHMGFSFRRRDGYELALASHGLDIDTRLIRAGEMTESRGYMHVTELLGLDDPPSAFLVSSVLLAIGARRAITDHGLQLGEDIALVTHDDDLSYLRNEGSRPQFTAMKSPVRAAGSRCAEILLKLVDNPDHPDIRELWESDFIRGTSARIDS